MEQFGTLNLRGLRGVNDVVRISVPYKLVSRENHPDRSVVRVGGVPIGPGTMTLIAGPCAVERVSSANFGEFLEVFCGGWGLGAFRERTERRFRPVLAEDARFRYYLARDAAGRGVGAAGTVMKDGFGYLVGAVVLPEHRGNGAYRSLIRGRLEDLRAGGRPFAVTQAREATSAPILEKLGFGTAYRAKVYRF